MRQTAISMVHQVGVFAAGSCEGCLEDPSIERSGHHDMPLEVCFSTLESLRSSVS
jgi:hypothetical protein